MKKLMTLMLGVALAVGGVAVTYTTATAADTTKDTTKNTTKDTTKKEKKAKKPKAKKTTEEKK